MAIKMAKGLWQDEILGSALKSFFFLSFGASRLGWNPVKREAFVLTEQLACRHHLVTMESPPASKLPIRSEMEKMDKSY